MVDFLRTFSPKVKEKYIEITSLELSTNIFINRIIEQCKEIKSENITIESIDKLYSNLERICADVKRIKELHNEIGRRFENHLVLMKCLDTINEIVNEYN